MALQLDFKNYELSSQRIARALYESMAVEGGRQVPTARNTATVAVPLSTGRGILSTDDLSRDVIRIKHIASTLTQFPLQLKKAYTISPYYIVPRYTVPSKLIVTAEDSDHSVFQAEGRNVVRRLRIRRIEVESIHAGKEYIDARGVDIAAPVNTAQPFGYTDPWPIDVILTPPEWFINGVKAVKRLYYHQNYEPVEGDSVKGLRSNALCGPREAVLVLHNRLSEEAKKAIDKYLSALTASISIDSNSTFLTAKDATKVKLKATEGSTAKIPASLRLEGARVTLDVYYAKNKYVVKTNADVQHLVPLEFAERNAVTSNLAIVEEILRQFFTKHVPDAPKDEATKLINEAILRLAILDMREVMAVVKTVKNASPRMDPRLSRGRAIDLTKLTEAVRPIGRKVKQALTAVGLAEILKTVDEELRENLIALIVFAITTHYYAGASLWNYFMRAIEEEEPITGHKQWKYAIGMNKIMGYTAPVIGFWVALKDRPFKSVNMVFEDVDSGEEVVLIPVPSRPKGVIISRYQVDTSTELAAEEAKIEGSVILPARCVEYLEHSDFIHAYYYTSSAVLRADDPTKQTPMYNYVDTVYVTAGGTGRNHLIHTSEILST